METLYQLFSEPFAYPFMQRAILAAIVTGVVCAVLSCYLVLKGWSLMGDAISHAVLPGIVLAFVLGIPVLIGAFFSGIFCAVATGYLKENSRVKEDTVMGIVFSGMFAFGLVLFSRIDTDQHLSHILFGNMLGITDAELKQTLLMAGITLLVVLLLSSKGAAGVTGSGFIVLAATISAVGHLPVAGLALILGIDRFMSEARALTNLVGNGVATVVVAKWVKQLDEKQLKETLDNPQSAKKVSEVSS